MIFNEELLFIHVGKTGGSSCASYLLKTLRGTVYNCHAGADREALYRKHRYMFDSGLYRLSELPGSDTETI